MAGLLERLQRGSTYDADFAGSQITIPPPVPEGAGSEPNNAISGLLNQIRLKPANFTSKRIGAARKAICRPRQRNQSASSARS
jgi:hypothetical protein